MAILGRSVNIKHLDLRDPVTDAPISTLKELLRSDAKCGGGIDLCNQVIKLKDTTAEGNPEYVIYVSDGQLSLKTLADFVANGF